MSQTNVCDTCGSAARVSKADGSQSLDPQCDALRSEGISGVLINAWNGMDWRGGEWPDHRCRRDPLPALGAVAVAVVAGLVALGSPTGQRLERLDARRAQDLDAISHAIDRYEATYERLPATLDELQRGSDVQVAIMDPVTREPYGYEAGEGTAYELCATFIVGLVIAVAGW